MKSAASEPLFPEFSALDVALETTRIHAVVGGAGPPVLLLHGYPQTHVIWHAVAPQLATRFTLVCPDLRGYGDSGKPESDSTHGAYAKRTMARDNVELMRELGFPRFAVIGHDRGARVARRLALDYAEAVTKVGLLDIVPTHSVYAFLDQQHATTVWRYFFLIQPADLPERLIGANREYYLEWTLREWCGTPEAITPPALAEYARCFDDATIHATCEDYRAGATIDLKHDRADSERRIACPTLVLWSRTGIGAAYDVLDIWRREAADVHGRALDCGHFLPEERPREVAEALLTFLAAD